MINVDPAKMKVAKRLNGMTVNGYGGYFGAVTCEEGDFFIIAIPHDKASVAELMREIES